MIRFTLFLYDGTTEGLDADSKKHLVEKYFENNEQLFKSKVKAIEYTHMGVEIYEDLEKGKIDRKIVGADTNPYGWRNEAE